jgi:hypothetical protein
MSGSVLFHRQRSPEDLQLPLAWYKIRDTLLGENGTKREMGKALELAAVCEHLNAVWLTKLFAELEVTSRDEARLVFLGCENDPRALCFAGLLGGSSVEIRRAADLGDAFAQSCMAWRGVGEKRFRWAEKSAAQGERDGFFYLGACYHKGFGCEKDVERASENFLAGAELGHVRAMTSLGDLFDKNDPQRFVWLGRAAANWYSESFLSEMVYQIRNFNSGTGHANVVFVIGRALKGHVNNDWQTIFGNRFIFHTRIGPANHALQFYEFQLKSYRKAVDMWTIIGLRNRVVKDIRKMIGQMIWDAREEVAYLEKK